MDRLLKFYAMGQLPVELIYLAKNGNITQRKISVLHVSGTTVTAYCHLRKTKRTFLLENILSFVPIKNRRETLTL